VGETAAGALGGAVDQYERASAAVAAAIIEHLPAGPPGPDGRLPLDDDATLRLAASITIDGIVAEQAALLIQLQEPEEPITTQRTRQLTALEAASLGDDLVTACAPLLAEVGGASGEPAAGSSVATHAYRILDRAGGDMVNTLRRGLRPWEHVAEDLAGQLGKAAAEWAAGAFPQVAQLAQGLRGLFARVWRVVAFKVDALAGGRGAELMKELIKLVHVSEWLNDAARTGAALALGKLLKADDAIGEADQLVRDHPDKYSAAMRACEEVDDHHRRRRRAVPWLNKSLPAFTLIHPPAGTGLRLAATVTLLVYSLWLAHDHIDSPVLGQLRLPRNPGLRTKICEALEVP